MSDSIQRTRPIGRVLRLLTGVLLLFSAGQVVRRASLEYILSSAGVVVGLFLFYMLVHVLISKYLPDINRWLGALVAVMPVALVFILGQGGGYLFGQGEGATGALAFVGLSLLIDVIRADAGCEVMALPGLLSKKRTHLACLAFTPIDWLEEKFIPWHRISKITENHS